MIEGIYKKTSCWGPERVLGRSTQRKRDSGPRVGNTLGVTFRDLPGRLSIPRGEREMGNKANIL